MTKKGKRKAPSKKKKPYKKPRSHIQFNKNFTSIDYQKLNKKTKAFIRKNSDSRGTLKLKNPKGKFLSKRENEIIISTINDNAKRGKRISKSPVIEKAVIDQAQQLAAVTLDSFYWNVRHTLMLTFQTFKVKEILITDLFNNIFKTSVLTDAIDELNRVMDEVEIIEQNIMNSGYSNPYIVVSVTGYKNIFGEYVSYQIDSGYSLKETKTTKLKYIDSHLMPKGMASKKTFNFFVANTMNEVKEDSLGTINEGLTFEANPEIE